MTTNANTDVDFDFTRRGRVFNASGALQLMPGWPLPVWAHHIDAYVAKTTTFAAREGNPKPDVAWVDDETMVNAVGLAGPGIDGVIDSINAIASELKKPIIASVSGSDSRLAEMVQQLVDDSDVVAIEVNVSCPNDGGAHLELTPDSVFSAVQAVTNTTSRACIVKLPPSVDVVGELARAGVAAGATVISAVNSLPVQDAVNEAGDQLLSVASGGMSGVQIHELAVRSVAAIADAVDIPIIGMGGINSVAAAERMFEAGAWHIAVGAGGRRDPSIFQRLAAAKIK